MIILKLRGQEKNCRHSSQRKDLCLIGLKKTAGRIKVKAQCSRVCFLQAIVEDIVTDIVNKILLLEIL